MLQAAAMFGRRAGRSLPGLAQLRGFAAEAAPAITGTTGYVSQVIGEWAALLAGGPGGGSAWGVAAPQITCNGSCRPRPQPQAARTTALRACSGMGPWIAPWPGLQRLQGAAGAAPAAGEGRSARARRATPPRRPPLPRTTPAADRSLAARRARGVRRP